MPNRLLREGILTSERVNTLSPDAEVFYRRLMSVVDDFGRYTAHTTLIRAALYPLQLDRVREASMERHLAECEKARLVRLYVVAGKRCLELLDFRQNVRAKDSKYPPPPTQADVDAPHQSNRCSADAVHQRSRCDADAHLDGDGDGDGDGDENTSSPGGDGGSVDQPEPAAERRQEKHQEAFAAFWQEYPRKVGKVPAEKSFRNHGCIGHMDKILPALKAQKQTAQWRKDGGQFIPHPATWLNQCRWQDEPAGSASAPAIEPVPMLNFIP